MRKETRQNSPCLPRTCSHQCAACQQEHCSCQQHRPRRAHAASSSARAPGSVVSAAARAAWLSCLVRPACACCMTSSRHKALHVGVCCKDPHPEGCCLFDLPVLPACAELVFKLDRKAWLHMTCGCGSIILLLSALVACMSAKQHGDRPTYARTCSAAVSVARPGCGCLRDLQFGSLKIDSTYC